MTIDQLPQAPSNFDLIDVPCAYGSDYKMTFGYVQDDSARETITIPASGNIRIDPPTTPGARIMFVTVLTWQTNTGAFQVVPYGTDQTYCYMIGTPGTTVSGLRLRFWFIL